MEELEGERRIGEGAPLGPLRSAVLLEDGGANPLEPGHVNDGRERRGGRKRLQFFGRWKDIATANDRYVDPACRDTYGCYRLFGHLLPAADRLQGKARRPSDMVQW